MKNLKLKKILKI